MSLLLSLCHELEARQVKYALVGGYAVALHGAVRGTVDIDLILDWQLANLQRAEESLKALGLRSLHPIDAQTVFRDKELLIREKNMIAWSFYNLDNPAQVIDIIITNDLHDKTLVTFLIQEQPVKVLAKHDLIRMKQESGRPQDIEDINALEALDHGS
jgi:hypothetical protein